MRSALSQTVLATLAATAVLYSGGRSAVAEAAKTHSLEIAGQLQQGRWELRDRQGHSLGELCVGELQRLIQLKHPDLSCAPLVLENTPRSVAVQYTCPGRGYGRTSIRRETEKLVQVETQGLADGLPFDFAAEGRWTGDCGRAQR